MTTLRIVSGSANPGLTAAVTNYLGAGPTVSTLQRFPDGELRPTVENVCGSDVYVVQPTAPPVNDHLVELLLLLDACRRTRAARITAVVPYFGYARQDHRSAEGEPLAARVVADMIAHAGADRLIVVDPHTATLERMCPIPVQTLTAIPILAQEIALSERVVVAPDEGAVKLAERYAAKSRDSLAVVRKQRETGATVSAFDVVGDVRNRLTVIVDDMISTGATIETAVGLLRLHDAAPDIIVAATHGVFTHGALGRLRALGLHRLIVTDTIHHPDPSPPIQVCSIAPMLAEAIARLHANQPMLTVPAPAR
ncbi:ribose-phosphate diphosphokinase [Nocardia pseudobrasiliensis]|uniref:ribose-phosphate diphosphokinase n=1 Tax=Nocardia pseudobrasiliensis TaxID=45979 RepID=A0A370HU06_9NOCA|nr:ribose-phosphate pyrophosphokinase [Nocardia pseudobrasiliensis]RDI60454.1 ribose-phosphate pyrophosphokinase [Nocardia pseudobrasiliensis]